MGYGQVAQAQFGMATGGLVGSGLGLGSPGLIPFASTDFIFAAIGEELGLLGTTVVLLLYVVLVGKGLRVALEQRDGFGQLLATGLATLIGLQTFVIVGGVTRVIPLTGVTLPFVSYGGSSLVSNFILLALLVRLSSGPAPQRGGLRSRGNRSERRRGAADGPADPPARRRAARAVRSCCSRRSTTCRCSPPTGSPTTPRTRTGSSRPSTQVDRGAILAADGRTVLASSRRSTGDLKYQRRYPQGDRYGHLTGFYSFVFGKHELESTFDEYLIGRRRRAAPPDDHRPRARTRQARRDDRHDDRARAPGGRGAGARLAARRRRRDRPATGNVLALVANPTFDPNLLSSQDAKQVRAAWDELNADPDKPLRLARERRAVPARLDVQARHGVGGARERLRPRIDVAEPAGARPPADRRDAVELRRRHLPGRRSHDHARAGARAVVQRDVRRDRARARAGGARRAGSASTGSRRRPGRATRSRSTSRGWRACSPTPRRSRTASPPSRSRAIGQQDVAANPLQMALVAGGDRQRRLADAPAARDRGPGPERPRDRHVRPRGVVAAALAGERRGAHRR